MNKSGIISLYKEETFYLVEEKSNSNEKIAVTEEVTSIDTPIEKAPIKRNGIAVLMYYPDQIPPDEKELVAKMLSAIQIEYSSCVVHNVKDHNDEIGLSSTHYLCFGPKAHQILLPDAPFYQLVKLKEVTYLFADDLKLIKDNVDLKRKLWDQLKVFNS